MKYRIIKSDQYQERFHIEKHHWLFGWELCTYRKRVGWFHNSTVVVAFVYNTIEEAEEQIIKWNTPKQKSDKPKVEVIKEIEV